MEVESVTSKYGCVHCGTPILDTVGKLIRCGGCSRIYPIVSGVPIFTRRPRALLQAYLQPLRMSESRIGELEQVLEGGGVFDSDQTYYRERVQRAIAGMRSNRRLLETYMSNAGSFLQDEFANFSLTDSISTVGAGWSTDSMLAYLHLDWNETDFFSVSREIIERSVLIHRPDSDAVAILGAGACGLVHALGSSFSVAHGIDLSAPTLIVANSVLTGDRVVIHLPQAGWNSVEVLNRRPRRDNVYLAVADAIDLPFQNDSFSVVVTQFLMDVVRDPFCVASEVCRVLKPRGLWLNLSLPLHKPTDPEEFGRLTLEELPAFLRPAGMHLIDARHEFLPFTDFQKIDKNASVGAHNVQLFAARKPSPFDDQKVAALIDRPPKDRAGPPLDAIPHYIKGNAVKFFHANSYNAGANITTFGVSFGLDLFPLNRVVLPEDHAKLLELVLKLVDGTKSIRQIGRELAVAGFEIDDGDLRELFYYLSDRHALVRVGQVDQD